MATAYKVLGQSNPAATSMTNLYTTPAASSAICSTLCIANLSAQATSFRVAIRPAGATLANQHYIAYDSPVAANDTIFLTLGITMAATDVLSVYAGTATVAFSLFGSEIS